MAKSVKALINPVLLRWARERASLSLDLASEKLKIKPEQLQSWEDGKAQPSFTQLMNISKVYTRPVTVFYLSEPPNDFMTLRDYRRLPGVIAPLNESPQLNIEIRKAYYRRQVALELIELLGEKYPKLEYRIALSQNPEEIGEELRELLSISLEKQISWRDDYQAWNTWRKALENIGVLVFQASKIDVYEMRGFAISERPLPTVVVNKKDSPKGRIFSMMHELAHIFLGDSSVSGVDLNNYTLAPEEKRAEVFCNHVAAAILLPKSAFETDVELKKYDAADDWTDTSVQLLAKRFNISREAIWRRLLTLGKIANQVYLDKRSELNRQRQVERDEEEPSKIRLKHHIKVLSSIGTFYPELVLNSYYQEKITSSTVSEYLGLKLKHLPKVENVIFGMPL